MLIGRAHVVRRMLMAASHGDGRVMVMGSAA
jgi:hypothetical protein